MNVSLVLAPSEKPVTLSQVKSFLRIDNADDDSLIDLLIDSCTERVEAFIDQKIITQKWLISFDKFPMSSNKAWWDGTKDGAISEVLAPSKFIDLPFGPCSAIESFKTIDNDGNEHLFTSDQYVLDTTGPWGRIGLKIGGVWPATVLAPVNGIRIQGVFGMGLQAAIPAGIKQAIINFTAKCFEQRGDEMPQMPPEVALLLEPYRRFKVGSRNWES